MSDFVEGIERSLYVMVEMKSLESQFRHAMTGIKQTFDALSTMHEGIFICTQNNEYQTFDIDNYDHWVGQWYAKLEQYYKKIL